MIEQFATRRRVISDVTSSDSVEDEGAEVLLDGAPAPDVPHPIATFEIWPRRAAGIPCLSRQSCVADLRLGPGFAGMRPQQADLIDVLVILFIGYLIFMHIARIWIDSESKIEEETQDQPDAVLGDEAGATVPAIATLLPLFRGAIRQAGCRHHRYYRADGNRHQRRAVCWRGCCRSAVGFGLRRWCDIFSGAFFLIDDAFRRGEYIDIGSVKGTVRRSPCAPSSCAITWCAAYDPLW